MWHRAECGREEGDVQSSAKVNAGRFSGLAHMGLGPDGSDPTRGCSGPHDCGGIVGAVSEEASSSEPLMQRPCPLSREDSQWRPFRMGSSPSIRHLAVDTAQEEGGGDLAGAMGGGGGGLCILRTHGVGPPGDSCPSVQQRGGLPALRGACSEAGPLPQDHEGMTMLPLGTHKARALRGWASPLRRGHRGAPQRRPCRLHWRGRAQPLVWAWSLLRRPHAQQRTRSFRRAAIYRAGWGGARAGFRQALPRQPSPFPFSHWRPTRQ